jgi:hypothetical protein
METGSHCLAMLLLIQCTLSCKLLLLLLLAALLLLTLLLVLLVLLTTLMTIAVVALVMLNIYWLQSRLVMVTNCSGRHT